MFLYRKLLDGSGNFPSLDALGAYFDCFGYITICYVYSLQVRQPLLLGPWCLKLPRTGVLVAYMLPVLWAFSADIASVRHF